MKLNSITVLLIVVAICFSIFEFVVVANGKDDEVIYCEMEATAYCYGTTRCDGGPARIGICATDSKHYGMIACVYEKAPDGSLGNFIGMYECLDTGGSSIRNGDVIDIYHPSYDWCINFGRKKVYVVFIQGNG